MSFAGNARGAMVIIVFVYLFYIVVNRSQYCDSDTQELLLSELKMDYICGLMWS